VGSGLGRLVEGSGKFYCKESIQSMIRKIFNVSQLIEYPVGLIGHSWFRPHYDVHVMLDTDESYKVFAGRGLLPTTGKVSTIFHGKISQLKVLCLQMLFTYEKERVPAIHYQKQLMLILASEPRISFTTLGNLLHADVEWLYKLLKISDYVKKYCEDICPANAYVLSKLKNPKPFIHRACMMSPSDFVPLINAEIHRKK
jgi:hypothetical protein